MHRLEGRRAVVTGAAVGIGAAIARRLHQEGARVLTVKHATPLLREDGGGATAR